MSDTTRSSEEALRELKHESESSFGSSSRQLLKIERSPSPSGRASTPDHTCPICLGDITNKSVTNSCLHQFCFFCLREWSKVKAECPLCKQKFTIIFHSIKSMGDYQEYHVEGSNSDPHIFINVAVQGATRFGYRTTMGLERNSPMMVLSPMSMSLQPQQPFPAHSGVTTRSASNARAQRAAIEFRRNIYRQNMWVRPPLSQTRVRESSPEFYGLNPAQTHRLVPWLMRELSVLFDGSSGFYPETACSQILDWITLFPINSTHFKRVAHHLFGNKTDHFVHEFYHFAISPHDLQAYDQIARYTPSTADLEMREPSDSQIERRDNYNLSPSDVGRVLPPLQLEPLNINDIPHQTFSSSINLSGGSMRFLRGAIGSTRTGGPLNFSSRGASSLITPPAPRAIEVIVLSSDEEIVVNSSNSRDGDAEIQLIMLDSDSDDDVIEIKPPTPALIEITDSSDDTPCPSPVPPPSFSQSLDAAGPSAADSSVPSDQKRSSRFFRPWYREYSSSSDDDLPNKKRSLSKKASLKRPSRLSSSKRSQAPKSSRIVSSSSSCSSTSSDSEIEIEEIKVKKVKRKRSKSSSSYCQDGSRGHKRRVLHDHEQRNKSSKKKKRRSSGSSSDEEECSKCCRRPKNSESKRSKSSKRKRRRSGQSSSTSSIEVVKVKGTSSSHSNGSSCKTDESSLPSPQPSSSFSRHSKALSKKAIILNKRNSELFAQTSTSPSHPQSSEPNGAMKKLVLLLSSSESEGGQYSIKKSENSFSPEPHPVNESQPGTSSEEPNRSVSVVDYSSDSDSSLSIGKEYVPVEPASPPSLVDSSSMLPESLNVVDCSQSEDELHPIQGSSFSQDVGSAFNCYDSKTPQSKTSETSHETSCDVTTIKWEKASTAGESTNSGSSRSPDYSSEAKVSGREAQDDASNLLDEKVGAWRRSVRAMPHLSPNYRPSSREPETGSNSDSNDALSLAAPQLEEVASPIMTFDHSPLTSPSNSIASSPPLSPLFPASIPPRLKSIVVCPLRPPPSETDNLSSSHSSSELSDN